MADYCVILVHSTSHAIQAERVLKRAGMAVKLIPTPRHLSSDCGSALRIKDADQTAGEKLLTDAGVSIERIEPLPS
ncbi:MAG: DUF3343 domain-containing protein [Planctomycetota bacterium]